MKSLSERNDVTPTLRSFYSYNGNLSALCGFNGKQRSQREVSVSSQASFDETPTPQEQNTRAVSGKKQENSASVSRIQTSFKDNHENLPSVDEDLALSDEACEKSPTCNTNNEPHVGSSNKKTSNDDLPLVPQICTKEKSGLSSSTRLTLVVCSVICAPMYNDQIPVDGRSIRIPENESSFVHCSVKDSNKASQQTNSCSLVQRLFGERVGPKETTVSGSTSKSIRKYRGVTRHKWTRKFEAHLWDGNSSTIGHTRKGKQVYLGGYETAEEAARAHDLTALKFWGRSASAKLNFHISNYENELKEMESMSREEFVTFLRRRSLSFTRGTSVYRGVTRNREGHWQARIKVASSKKDIYLGTFSSEEEAAREYDIAAIHFKGVNALTNFDITDYLKGGLKELESFPKPKRLRRSGKFSLSSLDSETDPCLDEAIPFSDSSSIESRSCKISALPPDHPTAMMPN